MIGKKEIKLFLSLFTDNMGDYAQNLKQMITKKTPQLPETTVAGCKVTTQKPITS